MIIDTHCHLTMNDFSNDLAEVITRAMDNNVSYMQTICTKRSDIDPILRLLSNYDNIFASVGLHPCNVDTVELFSVDELLHFSNHNKILSLGETGLDYYHSTENIALQKESFLRHIEAAQKTMSPLIIHTRDAENDTYEILASEIKNSHFNGIIHCFTGSKEFAYKMLDLGFYISFSGIVTFKNATALQDIARSMPLDRILVETDAPYLAPTPHRGQRNEPAFTKNVVESISQLKALSVDEIAEATTKNAMLLYKNKNFFKESL